MSPFLIFGALSSTLGFILCFSCIKAQRRKSLAVGDYILKFPLHVLPNPRTMDIIPLSSLLMCRSRENGRVNFFPLFSLSCRRLGLGLGLGLRE